MNQSPDFAALFDASPYPYLLIATDFVLIAANPAYLRATVRTANEIVGKNIFDAFPFNPADPDSTNLKEVRTSIEMAISTRRAHTSALLRYAVPRETPEGIVFEEKYWSAIHTPVFDVHGNVAFVSQNAIDVTDLYSFDETSKLYYLKQGANAVPDVAEKNRPQMHEAMTRILDVERNQLQMLFNQAPAFIAVLKGKDHIFELVNQAYYALVGQREVIGKPVLEALPEVTGQGFKELLDEVYSTGRPILMRDRQIYLQRERGKPVEERYMDLLYHPILGADGRATGIFAQGTDVTETYRAKARQAFQLEMADMLREAAAPADIFLRSCELIGKHFKLNKVVCGDYDVEHESINFHANYVDGTDTELVGIYHVDTFGVGNFASLSSGATWVSEDLSIDPLTSDSATWPSVQALGIYSAIIVPFIRGKGTIACMLLTANRPRQWSEDDVSLVKDVAERMWNAVERAQAAEALKEADRRKDQFLAMLAHELRNPLAPISAAAELLQFPNLPAQQIQNAGEIISRQVGHMTELVNDLLDVSRVSKGLVVLDKKEIDIKLVVSDAVEQVRPAMEGRRHRFSVQLPEEPIYVLGDYKRLVQVLTNLLSNAAKYTPEGGTISIQLNTKDGGQVALIVTDNGVGMNQELIPHVFELFVQGERSSDRSQGGLGLGLALVKSLVGFHGGTVLAESDGTNAGSRFTVCLPRLTKEPFPAYEQEISVIQNVEAGMSLLVVDDNVDAADMLGLFLEQFGYQVTIENDPFYALERAKQETFHAFLLDIGLPSMDGNQLARHLRSLPSAESAFMVAITGYGNDFDRETSLQAGFDDYVVKPANPHKIIELLKKYQEA